MINKIQLKLKTVQLNECFGLSKQFVTTTQLHSTKRSKIKYRPDSAKHCKTEIFNSCKEDLKIKPQTNKVHPLLVKFNDMQINRYDFRKYFCVPTSYQCKTNYRNFPKRQISIKNTNPFKFYLNNTVKLNRVSTEPTEPLKPQSRVLVKSQVIKVKRPLTTGKCRRFTQSVRQIGETTRITRPKSVSMVYRSKQLKQKEQIIDPWETSPDNIYTSDF